MLGLTLYAAFVATGLVVSSALLVYLIRRLVKERKQDQEQVTGLTALTVESAGETVRQRPERLPPSLELLWEAVLTRESESRVAAD